MEPWPELVRAEPKKDWDLQGARNQETMAVRSPDVQIA